ncbi:MAG: carbohydrate kinase family protein [Actinomycetota bacterium]|nr:carbohydrate kinase family protein [Actinomycetota bacterium]
MTLIPGAVLCAGNLTKDILVWPVDQVVFNTTVWVEDIVNSLGGNGANTAFAIGRLGGRVRLVGLVGHDEDGQQVLEQLESVGVELRVERSELPTPVTVVVVRSDGARSFLHRPGASRHAFDQPLRFLPDLIEGCSHFHLANPFSMPAMREQAGAAVESARAAGLTTSLDTGWDAKGQWLEVIRPCLPHLDLLFVNDGEAEKLSGSAEPCRAAEFFREHGVQCVIIKLGAQGCAVFQNGAELYVPGFKIEAVDSTGAGDCFAGAYLTALQRGLPAPEAARFANAAGPLSAERAGATTGLLGYDATMRWIASRGE